MPSQAGKYAVPCRKMTPGSKPIPLALPSLWKKHSRGAFRLPGGLFLRLLGGSIICLTNRGLFLDLLEGAHAAPVTAQPGVAKPQQRVHLFGGILVPSAGVVHQDVIHLPDLPGGRLAEAAHGGRQGKDPNRRNDGDMTAGRKVNFHGPDGHGPTMHTVAAAPPETQRALGPFGGADLIEGGAGALRLLTGQLFCRSPCGKNRPPAGWDHCRCGGNRSCSP